MGTVAGLLLGAGLLLVWSSTWAPAPPRPTSRLVRGWQDLTAQAGLHRLGLGPFAAASAGLALVVGLVALGLGTAVSVAVAFALLASAVPLLYLRSRAQRRRVELRTLWPDVVDDLTSAVRAGLTLPEALIAQAERGPVELRADMAAFAAEYRATGRFVGALEVWQTRLADPVADRLAVTLRLATEVGGTDLGRTLRTLSEFLRADLRTRGELEARQSWTVNGARLAVAAPWVVLLLMSGRGSTSAAFDTPAGVAVLVLGAVLSAIAYAAMLRIGRLPEEPRVLRAGP
ncbi:type II secretion system protein F [Miniimonas arenae]|uniref:Type II secretion system protein F n=1 Tax=Miniimonas arenae TaxID=676201 RepID=A0A5C5BEF1_9MICO|nr:MULTISPECIES: type II secretion system F family protein [Miniimonas]TNU75817.1 type II secretion system protein F [Miniimonas arenae]